MAGREVRMEHYWRDLPGPIWFSGADLYARYVASVSGPSVAVELGAWKGRSTSCMGVEIARSGKPIRFHAVDTWQGSDGEIDHAQDADVAGGTLYDAFCRNIAPVAEHIIPIRSDSGLAAGAFDDSSVDFLYVDAAHTYEGVIRDLSCWFSKVQIGGTIAGDDWCYVDRDAFAVRQAVRDFFGRHADRVVVEPGAGTDREWLQWSIVRTADLRPAPAPVILGKRCIFAILRLLRGLRWRLRRVMGTAPA